MRSYVFRVGDDLESLFSKEQKDQIESARSVLMQLFCGEGDERFGKICSFLASSFPSATLIGSSTDGEICNDEVTTQKSVLCVTLFEETELKVAYAHKEESFETGRAMARELLPKEDLKLIISFADGIACNGEEYLRGIASILPDVKIAGGLAGDNGVLKQTTIMANGKLYHKGAVAVALYSKTLQVSKLYSFGWRRIGLPHKVTSSKKNRVYTIDGMRAVDFYKKYLGEDIAEYLPAVGIEFPLVMQKDEVLVARAVLEKHEDGSLSFAGNIAEGEEVYIGVGSKEEIVANPIKTEEMVVESFFIYSCMARRRFLPELVYKEIEPFASTAPTAGFFTYGEFYTDDIPQLLNQTLTAVALSESTQKKKIQKKPLASKRLRDIDITQEALTNILNQTSKDLEAVNQLREKEILSSQQAKLVQMGEMVNMIAHQWRQPLNAISAASIKLTLQAEMGLCSKDEIIQTTHFIEETTQDMSKTINDFMNFTKPTDKKVEISLKEIVDDILRIMGAQLKNHNINFIEEIEEELVISTFNKDLEHILINLISNARDAFDAKEMDNKEIRFRAYTKQKDCIIEVEDNAGGIPKGVIEKIFNPYFTTKEQGKGTGLGLYMSKKILTESIGGTIDVCNTKEGAKFTILLKDAVC